MMHIFSFTLFSIFLFFSISCSGRFDLDFYEDGIKTTDCCFYEKEILSRKDKYMKIIRKNKANCFNENWDDENWSSETWTIEKFSDGHFSQDYEHMTIQERKEHFASQIAIQKEMFENLKKFKDNPENEDALKAINDALIQTKDKNFVRFYNPFDTIRANISADIYSENDNDTFIIENMNNREIQSDRNLRTKARNKKVFLFQYADHTPSILGALYSSGLENGPKITGTVYAIQEKGYGRSRISGSLVLRFSKDNPESIHIVFGTKMMVNGEPIYTNDIIVDENNKVQSGKLTFEYMPSESLTRYSKKVFKTYDFEKLSPQDKEILKNFKMFQLD